MDAEPAAVWPCPWCVGAKSDTVAGDPSGYDCALCMNHLVLPCENDPSGLFRMLYEYCLGRMVHLCIRRKDTGDALLRVLVDPENRDSIAAGKAVLDYYLLLALRRGGHLYGLYGPDRNAMDVIATRRIQNTGYLRLFTKHLEPDLTELDAHIAREALRGDSPHRQGEVGCDGRTR